jgi:hypothetical protein
VRACPGVTVLASSREALESVLGSRPTGAIAVACPTRRRHDTAGRLNQYEAVRLINRAEPRLARPDFAVTNQVAPALASALLSPRRHSARAWSWPPRARARCRSKRSVARLDNRFRLLTGGSRTHCPAANVAGAHRLELRPARTDRKRSLLHRLVGFSGGWTLEAGGSRVCWRSPSGETVEDWEVFDLLTALVDKSLALARVSRRTHTLTACWRPCAVRPL